MPRRAIFLLLPLSITILLSIWLINNRGISWVASGEWIAFSCSSAGIFDQSSIYLMRSDGSNVQRLTSNGIVASMPAWSSDGERIAFVNNHALYKMQPDGTNIEQILDNHREDANPYWDSLPAWSPDGEWIAFISNRSGLGAWDIYRVRPDGTDLQQLTFGQNIQRSLMWSPNGQWIIFTSMSSENTPGIYKMRSDGSDQQLLTQPDQRGDDPAWSPDGEWIVFSLDDAIGINLYRIRVDGSNLQPLTNFRGANNYPEWSRDGAWIVFSSQDSVSGLSQIYKMKSDGSEVNRITNMDCNAVAPTWFNFPDKR